LLKIQEESMTAYETGTASTAGLSTPPTWVRILLGIVFILAGVFVLGDVALATIISTIFIGLAAIAVGAFEIVHSFWTKGWGGFIWQILLGLLYIAFGFMVVRQPATGALILTYVLGLLLLASGIVRIVLGIRHWSGVGWIMFLSGAFAVLAGLVILTGWPMTGLWVLGLLLGIDLIAHGVAWLTYGWLPTGRNAVAGA
jgi:uncharacterized membrane protein HdeD (DUF308 family)